MAENPYHYQKLRQRLDDLKARCSVRKMAQELGKSEIYIKRILSGEAWGEPTVMAMADYLGVPRRQVRKSAERRKP